MGKIKMFDIFFERHIGFGIRWDSGWTHTFNLSIAIPFITVTIGFGKLYK